MEVGRMSAISVPLIITGMPFGGFLVFFWIVGHEVVCTYRLLTDDFNRFLTSSARQSSTAGQAKLSEGVSHTVPSATSNLSASNGIHCNDGGLAKRRRPGILSRMLAKFRKRGPTTSPCQDPSASTHWVCPGGSDCSHPGASCPQQARGILERI